MITARPLTRSQDRVFILCGIADERLGLTREQIEALVADPIEFTGAAVAQTRAVVARVEALAARHPDAASYVPGAIL